MPQVNDDATMALQVNYTIAPSPPTTGAGGARDSALRPGEIVVFRRHATGEGESRGVPVFISARPA